MRRHVSDLAWRPIIKGGDIDEIVVAMENEEANIDSVGGPRYIDTSKQALWRLYQQSGVSRPPHIVYSIFFYNFPFSEADLTCELSP